VLQDDKSCIVYCSRSSAEESRVRLEASRGAGKQGRGALSSFVSHVPCYCVLHDVRLASSVKRVAGQLQATDGAAQI
jgi:hypothetical protein